MKAGTLVVEEGQLRRAPAGRRVHVRPAFDRAVAGDIERYLNDYGTVRFANYPVGELRDAPVSIVATSSSGAR